jgi:hypothetical protein
MNERIKELALQADAFIHRDVQSQSAELIINEWEQKFAELIVRECAKIVEGSSLPDAYSESCLVLIAEDIKEHFGVK